MRTSGYVCVCAQSCLTLCDPMGYSLSMEFSGQERCGAISSSRDLPDPGIEPESPA